MDSKLIWTVLFVLCFLPWKVIAGYGMKISPDRMTWLESFSYCTLPDEDSIQDLRDGNYRGWVGGIYLNSQWMVHKGCHSQYGSMNSNGVYDIKSLTPTLCSEKCKMNEYFALKYNWCLCLQSLYNLNEVDSSRCTYKCAGSNIDICGERSYFTVYQHILGKFKLKSDVDQRLACSVIVPRNDSFVLKAVDCSLEYWTACVISGVTRHTEFIEPYHSAIRRCSSLNRRILSTIANLDNLVEGREYWSNIVRFRFLKWTTNKSFEEICHEVNGLLNVDCLHLEVNYWKIKYIPLPCKYKYTAICKPKQPGDQAIIRQCETTSTMEISARERPTSSTKHEKEGISAEETIFTSTSVLTSTHERTDKAVLLSSTITYKSRTFSAPSVPIKSTKVVASIAITKEEISTREISASSTNHEKEETLSEETSTEETTAEETSMEETSAEETKFRSTSILSSSRESTDTSVLIASTIPYKSTTFSAPSVPIKSTKDVVSSMPIMSTKFDYTKFANGSSTKEHHFSITSTFSIVVLVILIVFVLVCLQISLIGILRRHWRAKQEVNQYELTSPLTEPSMYAQPEIHHYEVVDDTPS